MPQAPRLPGNVIAPRQSVQSLIDRSWAARYEDVATCHRLASLAVALAERTPDRDLRASALAHLGNAERILGNFTAAWRSLRRAQQEWSAGSQDAALGALSLEFLGSLYEAVRDFDSAIKVLRDAERLRRAVGNPEGLAKVHIQQGIVLGYAGLTVGAIDSLRKAIRETSDPDLLRFAVQPLVRFYVEAEEPTAALDILSRCDRLLRGGGPLFKVKTTWHRALVVLALGSPSAAQVLLHEVRNAYLERGMAQEAAFCSFDLSLALLKGGDTSEARRILVEAEPLLEALGISRESQAAQLLHLAITAAEEQCVSALAGAVLSEQAHRAKLDAA
jgi:tetratricopeptide (TPR) repeat protein